jgi:4-hydroxy-3-methylbut-2-enyl diphosphate reductase
VAKDAGAKAAYRVDFASEIEDAWFDGVETVGVSSGASVPEELVDEVIEQLAKRGFGDVESVTTAEEDIQFSLPHELRKDLKAASQGEAH